MLPGLTLLGLVRCVRVVVLVVAAASLLFTAVAGRPGADNSLASLSGRALVQRLEGATTRARAFHELWTRADGRRTSFEDFSENHRDIELVVCPQRGGRGPIYLLLYDFLPESLSVARSAYPIARPDELFPAEPDAVPPPKRHPAIDAYTSSGQSIDPFGGNNVLDGTLADINGDGLIERVETVRYGGDGIETAEVLHVWVVEPKARSIFSVLINWGADEWGYRLRDQNGDGIAEIEIGPRSDGILAPAVTFAWDARSRTYRSPTGREGDHFRVLDAGSGKTEAALKTLRASNFAFAATPRTHLATHKTDRASEPPTSAPQAHQPGALSGFTDEQLLRLMGDGPNAYERERAAITPNRLPPRFWELDPKAAALALAELNRTDAHRRRFRLALDDRDGSAPPASGSITLTAASSRCYVASDAHYYLRFSPEESYLAFARSSAGGAVFHNIVSDRPAIDLRLCPLSYDDARRLAATLWWLDRVRSRDRIGSSGRMGGAHSTADGFAEFVLSDELGKPLLEKSDTRWAADISERWTDDYAAETFVNFAVWLVADALVEHLGEAWTHAAPPPATIAHLRKEPGPFYAPEQIRHLSTLAKRFLASANSTPPKVSPGVAIVAIEAVGDLALAEIRPDLKRLLDTLPARSPAASAPSAKTDWPSALRTAAEVSLRKIDNAEDPAALQAWAAAKLPGAQWALRQLATLDPARYAQLLEDWLANARAREGRQLFEELVRVAPERATELARALSLEKRRALVPPEFLLRSAPSENEGVSELIAVLLDRASGWDQRGDAVAALAPATEPLRHSHPAVDAALLRALEPDMADENLNFTSVAACRALARRGRTEHFDRIARLFQDTRDVFIADELLAPLVDLARAAPESLNPRLSALLAPHLVATNRRLSEIFWALWSADLREFQPRIQELATSDPAEIEDGGAVTSGGEISAVSGRFHLARKIAAIWNERDAFTRARLLAAFALHRPYEIVGEDNSERADRLRSALADCVRELNAARRKELEASFSALALASASDASTATSRATVVEILRDALSNP